MEKNIINPSDTNQIIEILQSSLSLLENEIQNIINENLKEEYQVVIE